MKINFTYRLARGLMSLLFVAGFALTAQAQERTISGTVSSDEDGGALPGVNVIVKGTTIGTVTDIEGNYRLEVPEGDNTLQFSFIGYVTEEVEAGNQSTINITLASDVQALQEVVVQGYGEQSERYNTQQISQISSEEFATQPVVNVQDLLQGRAAGVQMTSTSGVLGARTNVRIRGGFFHWGGQPTALRGGWSAP